MESPTGGEGAQDLLFTATVTPSHVWVQVGGELDLANRDALHHALQDITLPERLPVQVDLRRLTFCDTAGARALLQFRDRARSAGHPTDLYGAPPIVERLLVLIIPTPRPGSE